MNRALIAGVAAVAAASFPLLSSPVLANDVHVPPSHVAKIVLPFDTTVMPLPKPSQRVAMLDSSDTGTIHSASDSVATSQ